MDSQKPLELVYRPCSRWRRAMSFLIDGALSFILGLAIGIGVVALVTQSSFYQGAVGTMNEIELRSGLYEERDEGGTIAITELYAVSEEDPDPDYAASDSLFATALDAFFSDDYFFPEGDGASVYDKLKIGDQALIYQGNEGNGPYFRRDEEGNIVPRLSSQAMYAFYVEAIDGTAIPLISTVEAYIDASRTTFLSMGGSLIGSLFLGAFLSFFLPPLFFRRGRQTLGLKAMRLAVLTAKAVPPSLSRTAARSLIFLLIEVLLSIFAFLLPLLVSITMVMVRKDRQSFHDYVAGTYVVDSSDMPVFLSYEDYVKKTGSPTPIDLEKGKGELEMSPEEKEDARRGID